MSIFSSNGKEENNEHHHRFGDRGQGAGSLRRRRHDEVTWPDRLGRARDLFARAPLQEFDSSNDFEGVHAVDMSLKRNIRQYFTVNGLFSLGRALPQAILTPILVGKGLTFSEIAIVQAVFSACQLLLEFPSGIVSDMIGRKLTYLASIAFMIASYALVFLASGLPSMSVAWGLYGAAAALQSATLDYYFVEKLRDDERALRKFYSRDRNIVLAASIVAALAAPSLYRELQGEIYILAIASMGAAFLVGCISLPRGGNSDIADDTSPARLREELKLALADSRLMLMVAIFSAVEFAVTPFFQMWQMVFVGADVALHWFGVFFIVSQVFNIISNWIFAWIGSGEIIRYLLLIVILGVGLVVAVNGGSKLGAVMLVGLPLPLFLYMAEAEVALQKVIPATLMSSVGSLAGTVGSVVSLVILMVAARAIPFWGAPAVLGGSLVVFSVLSMLLLAWLHRYLVVGAVSVVQGSSEI